LLVPAYGLAAGRLPNPSLPSSACSEGKMAFPVAVIPILAEIALSVTKAALDRKQADPVIARKIENEIAANPVLANELNAEKPYQSRVVVGSSGALLPAVGYLIWAFSSNGFDLAAYDPSSTF